MEKKQKYIGLTAQQVQESRRQYGRNVLTPVTKEPWWKKFGVKFRDPLIVILLIAGFLSIGISCYEYWGLHGSTEVFFEPVGIFIAIILATGLAFIFEYRADKEFALLNQINDEESVTVIRDGHIRQIPRREVVVGDIVMLSTGEEVPADGRLLESTTLTVDESTLTGEPLCHKSENPADADEAATYPTHQVLKGTKVMEGHGVFQVERVGDATESGKVFTAAQIDDGVKTPLDEQMQRLGTLISRASYTVAGLVVVARLAFFFITQHPTPITQHLLPLLTYFLQTIMIAVTLIVVAVPEGLPMAVTLSLAYSMRRMLKTKNLVRKMHACETMGAATVICTDKTGTLTQNKMQVAEVFTPQPSSSDSIPPLCRGGQEGSPLTFDLRPLHVNMSVNSTAQLDDDEVIGNPTEGALLLWLKGQGIDYQQLRDESVVIEETPFTTERKYMTTVVRSKDERGKEEILHLTKGAPEIVMDMCEMTDDERKAYEEKLLDDQSRGMRTLAFACNKKMQAIVAISDPVREDVPAAVQECLDAGIDIKIVTGDTPLTALEIARQVGLTANPQAIINGSELEALTDEELRERVKDLKIIARARPMDKKRLVEALQANGEVVAVTGDGTNDAPALKTAHVGLSMGDGTSVAKEASDITIIDNSFSSIGRAVMWGRSLYRNIQRFILFQLTVNVVACLIVFLGACFDTQSPLTVTQMLWVNLIMDTFAAMALASLPPAPQVMKFKPRNRSAFIISHPMRTFILGMGLAFTAVLMVMLICYEKSGGLTAERLSIFFTVFVMLQFWNLFNAKAFMTGESALKNMRHSKEFLFIVLLVFFGQILIVQFGGRMFNVVPLSLTMWLTIIAATSPVFIIGELVRMIKK
jgi:Ca2+-transporting ATPase